MSEDLRLFLCVGGAWLVINVGAWVVAWWKGEL